MHHISSKPSIHLDSVPLLLCYCCGTAVCQKIKRKNPEVISKKIDTDPGTSSAAAMQADSTSTLAAAGNDFSGRLVFDSAGGVLFSTLATLLDHSARRAVASAQPAVQPEARIILRTHSEDSQVMNLTKPCSAFQLD